MGPCAFISPPPLPKKPALRLYPLIEKKEKEKKKNLVSGARSRCRLT